MVGLRGAGFVIGLGELLGSQAGRAIAEPRLRTGDTSNLISGLAVAAAVVTPYFPAACDAIPDGDAK